MSSEPLPLFSALALPPFSTLITPTVTLTFSHLDSLTISDYSDTLETILSYPLRRLRQLRLAPKYSKALTGRLDLRRLHSLEFIVLPWSRLLLRDLLVVIEETALDGEGFADRPLRIDVQNAGVDLLDQTWDPIWVESPCWEGFKDLVGITLWRESLRGGGESYQIF